MTLNWQTGEMIADAFWDAKEQGDLKAQVKTLRGQLQTMSDELKSQRSKNQQQLEVMKEKDETIIELRGELKNAKIDLQAEQKNKQLAEHYLKKTADGLKKAQERIGHLENENKKLREENKQLKEKGVKRSQNTAEKLDNIGKHLEYKLDDWLPQDVQGDERYKNLLKRTFAWREVSYRLQKDDGTKFPDKKSMLKEYEKQIQKENMIMDSVIEKGKQEGTSLDIARTRFYKEVWENQQKHQQNSDSNTK